MKTDLEIGTASLIKCILTLVSSSFIVGGFILNILSGNLNLLFEPIFIIFAFFCIASVVLFIRQTSNGYKSVGPNYILLSICALAPLLCLYNIRTNEPEVFYFSLLLSILPLIIAFIMDMSLLVGFLRRKKKLLTEKPIKTPPQNPVNNLSISPLLQQVLSGKAEQVQAALVQDPAQLNTPYAQNGNTPLHVAVWNNQQDIVKFLLAQPGIDTQAKNLAGKTALDLAREKNFTEIIELLKFTEK